MGTAPKADLHIEGFKSKSMRPRFSRIDFYARARASKPFWGEIILPSYLPLWAIESIHYGLCLLVGLFLESWEKETINLRKSRCSKLELSTSSVKKLRYICDIKE